MKFHLKHVTVRLLRYFPVYLFYCRTGTAYLYLSPVNFRGDKHTWRQTNWATRVGQLGDNAPVTLFCSCVFC